MANIMGLAKVAAKLAWPAAAIISVGVLFSTSRSSAVQISNLEQRRDSLLRQIVQYNAALTQKLIAGDSIPDVELADRDGRVIRSRVVARSGARYWYFYKADCVACQLLAPAFIDPGARPTTVIRVAFNHLSDELPDSGVNTYAWRHDSLTRQQRIIEYVPALLVVDQSGVVTNAAYGLPQVARMGVYYNLLDRDSIRDALARSSGSRPAAN